MSIAASRRADFSEIPIIDIDDIDAAAGAIRDACENVGFFYAKNHGVPLAQQDGMFEQCRRFFSLPQEEREALLLTKSPHYRGFLPIGARGSDQKRQKDLLESFNIASERGPDDPFVRAGKPLHGPNQWPPNLPGFREALLAYYAAMEGLMRRLLQGVSLAMGCERHALDPMFRNPLCQLRLLHYPQQGEVTDMIGARAHRDFGVITILLQDDVGGLEVQNNAGEWVVAPPIRDTFVVNFGLMMLHLSNDRYLAAQHRVVNRYGRERFSIPFFVNPDYDATLETLPQFLGRGEEPRYAPVHAGEKLRAFYHNLWPSAGKGSLQ